MSSAAFPSLQTPVIRTYQVGLRFEGQTRDVRRQQEVQANQIIRELQHTLHEKITAERAEQAITVLRRHPGWSGTTGAAKLAKVLADRSNIGQAAYLILLNAAKGVIDREQKLQVFLEFLRNDVDALVEWLVFGRTPYLEQRLTYHFGLHFDYCRNLVLSARRTLDPVLPTSHRLTAPLPSLSIPECLQAIDHFTQTKLQELAQLQELSENQQRFQQKLRKLHHYRQQVAEQLSSWIAEWNQPTETTPASRWKFLKQLSKTVHVTLASLKKPPTPNAYVYLSSLRGILVSALLPYLQANETVKKLHETHSYRVEQLVPKPFRKKNRKASKLLPLPLVMGSKYVVGRPGNNGALTALLREEGEFQMQIWRPRQKRRHIQATLRIHSKLRDFLANGAQIRLVVLRSGLPPANKLRVSLVLEGHYWMFLSRTAIEQMPVPFYPVDVPVDALGLDLNRPSPYMLTFSEPIQMPPLLLKLCQRFKHLGEVIHQVSKAVTRAENWVRHFPSVFSVRYRTKMQGELKRVYDRRARLLAELKRGSFRFVASVLVQTYCSLFCIENLHLTARGTRGALAKAVLAMPDEEDLYMRAVLLASYITARPITLRKVNPAYTSQGTHLSCSVSPPGRLIRHEGTWDYARCSVCQHLVNTHQEAAHHIRELGIAMGDFPIYLIPSPLFAYLAAPLSL